MATNKPAQPMGGVTMDLGLGSALNQQLADETEDEKKKRMLGMSALQSPAAQMLLGGMPGAGKV